MVSYLRKYSWLVQGLWVFSLEYDSKALYEMLRVAKEGIFLIEPFDHGFWGSNIFHTRKGDFHVFEEGPGNYSYSFSERELEKLGVSHGWSFLAVRGICCLHDLQIPLESNAADDLARYRQIVEEREAKAEKGECAYTSMCSILLRKTPSAQLRQDLMDAGFSVLDLARNPHLIRDVLKNLAAFYEKRSKESVFNPAL